LLFRESLRLLALNVHTLLNPHERKSILVMSPFPGDGRSMLSGALAEALCDVYPQVLLIDADPVSGVQPNGRAGWRWWRNGHVRGAQLNGHFPTYGILRLARTGMNSQANFIGDARESIEAAAKVCTVVVDVPACTSSSIPFYLASYVTGIIYIVRGRSQDSAVHRDIRDQLDMLGARILGVVFNEG
jgi:Mrp family chromosome partitioning ATPase